jgi:hypothetical protein
MTRINEELGRPMSAQQAAAYFNIDVKTVRKYYKELGGIRIGNRYKFFEMEVCNAVQKGRSEGRQDTNDLYRTSEEKREEDKQAIQDEKRSSGVGVTNEKLVRKRLEQKDRHGLFG